MKSFSDWQIALTHAAIHRKFLNVDESTKETGKTEALVYIAKKFHLQVVVPTKEDASYIMRTYDFINVFAEDEVNGLTNKKVMTDEGVSLIKLLDKGIEIVAGYITKKEEG